MEFANSSYAAKCYRELWTEIKEGVLEWVTVNNRQRTMINEYWTKNDEHVIMCNEQWTLFNELKIKN
jgi:hypothetical protein